MAQREFWRQMDDWKRTYGRKTVTTMYNVDDQRRLFQMVYDYVVDGLSLRWISYVEPEEFFVLSRFDSLSLDIAYRWSQQLRGIMIYNAATGTTSVRPYQLDIRETRPHIKFSPPPP
ncbi:hypothetical protein VTN49DRAFT_3541 [Thermomyces lanuginosus]|uniref:uncharacterized protein n=1 Tax=Thermomyces lanuginosus TaxID=5541 RepID=UPI003742DB56